MKTPLEIIAGYGVSTTSYIRAVQDLNTPDRWFSTQEEYEQEIAKIIGSDHPPSFASFGEAKICFLYIIQEIIRASLSGIPDIDLIWTTSQQKTKELIAKHPWLAGNYTNNELDDRSRGKKSKRERAEQLYKKLNNGVNDRSSIIEAIVAETGLTKGGATAYFHDFKKRFGYKGPSVPKRKRVNIKQHTSTPRKDKIQPKQTKGQIAREVYLSMIGEPKEKVIAEIISKTGTTPAGANTYYCLCKKEFQPSEHTGTKRKNN